MQKVSINPKGTGAPMSVPKPGSVSSVGPTGAAPAPRGLKVKNTRDYGKPAAPVAPTPSPFGITDGGSRLGGI